MDFLLTFRVVSLDCLRITALSAELLYMQKPGHEKLPVGIFIRKVSDYLQDFLLNLC